MKKWIEYQFHDLFNDSPLIREFIGFAQLMIQDENNEQWGRRLIESIQSHLLEFVSNQSIYLYSLNHV